MAILYYVKVTNPNNVNLFPPSLASYQTTLLEALANAPKFVSENGSSAHLFSNVSALTTTTNAITLSGANLTAMNEWKTANNITIEYSVLGLTATADTPPTPFGN
jgi:hypothetical protein